ncbi:transposase [Gammaproteobacteria bacterium]
MNTANPVDVTKVFCDLDDFNGVFIPAWRQSLLPEEKPQRDREFIMSPAEVMTILILFHCSGFRNLKNFYIGYVPFVLGREFPNRVSYNRFVELEQSVLVPLCAYLNTRRVTSKGIAFIDSTPLRVCHNRRIPRHRTFNGLAARGKTSVDWYYGFKLHLVIDDQGELVSFLVTPGNIDDRKGLKEMAKFINGKLFGDKGYISKALQESLWEQGIELITKIRKNMKKVFIGDFDKIMLRKRSIIETVNDQLKNISQLEHTRHRSLANFMVNIVCALIAYSWQPKKPSLNLRNWKTNSTDLIVVEENNTLFLSRM